MYLLTCLAWTVFTGYLNSKLEPTATVLSLSPSDLTSDKLNSCLPLSRACMHASMPPQFSELSGCVVQVFEILPRVKNLRSGSHRSFKKAALCLSEFRALLQRCIIAQSVAQALANRSEYITRWRTLCYARR